MYLGTTDWPKRWLSSSDFILLHTILNFDIFIHVQNVLYCHSWHPSFPSNKCGSHIHASLFCDPLSLTKATCVTRGTWWAHRGRTTEDAKLPSPRNQYFSREGQARNYSLPHQEVIEHWCFYALLILQFRNTLNSIFLSLIELKWITSLK